MDKAGFVPLKCQEVDHLGSEHLRVDVCWAVDLSYPLENPPQGSWKCTAKVHFSRGFGWFCPHLGSHCNGCGSAPSEGSGLEKSCNEDQTDPNLLTHLLHIHIPRTVRSNGDRGLQLQAHLVNTEVKIRQLLPPRSISHCSCRVGVIGRGIPAPISHLDFSKNRVGQEECLVVPATASFSENEKKRNQSKYTCRQTAATLNSQQQKSPILGQLSHFTSPLSANSISHSCLKS